MVEGRELDTRQPIDRRDVGLWSINRFYYLDGRKNLSEILWHETTHWRPVLGEKAVRFAENGCGDQFFLDLSTSPPCVKLCIHDDQFKIIDIASSSRGIHRWTTAHRLPECIFDYGPSTAAIVFPTPGCSLAKPKPTAIAPLRSPGKTAAASSKTQKGSHSAPPATASANPFIRNDLIGL